MRFSAFFIFQFLIDLLLLRSLFLKCLRFLPSCLYLNVFMASRLILEFSSVLRLTVCAGVCIFIGCTAITDMHARDCTLILRDLQKVLADTDFQAWVKHWLPCRGQGMSDLFGVIPEVECPFFAVVRNWNMKRILKRLCDFRMGSCYLTLVFPLLSCSIYSVLSILPRARVAGHVIETSSLVYDSMQRR